MLELDAINELMGGVRVIIATLSMLSSHNLMVNSFFTTFPMGALLVDEASQIRLDELPHIFNRFRKTLDRVAFFGDERQREPRTLIPEKTELNDGFFVCPSPPLFAVAPYNSAQVPQIQSVFQLPHLKADAFFLNTECPSTLHSSPAVPS